MSIRSGAITYRQFRIPEAGWTTSLRHDSVKARPISAGLVPTGMSRHGWATGTHLLDLGFDWGSTVYDEAVLVAMRHDSNKLPRDLLRAYYEIDLAALAKDNSSGRPSKRQKREAKESALERLEHEAQDGRYIKRKLIDTLLSGDTLFWGESSTGRIDAMLELCRQTFGAEPEPITAESMARDFAVDYGFEIESLEPSKVVTELAWVMAEDDLRWLGNEFLIWLWWNAGEGNGTIKLPAFAGHESSYMFSRSMRLDCGRGTNGTDSIHHDSPVSQPEALIGLRRRKIPRRAGISLCIHDKVYEFTLHPEAWVISGLKLPKPDSDELNQDALEHSIVDCRISYLIRFNDALKDMYHVFLDLRLSEQWERVETQIARWIDLKGGE